MFHVRHIVRAVTFLLVLAASLTSGTAALAKRVVINDGGDSPLTNTPAPAPQQEGSPLWMFLLVAACAIVATVIAERAYHHLHHTGGHGHATPA